MNRRTAARVIPSLILVTLVLTGCCNENWRGLGTVSGTLTINGAWPGEIDRITVQSIDKCDNKYVHFFAGEGLDLNAVIDALTTYGTFTVDLEPQEVIASEILTRFMVRLTTDFRSLYETRTSVTFKLKKNGEKVVNLTYTFPATGSR